MNMEDEFEAMKIFQYHEMHLFLVEPRPDPHIIDALKRLECDKMIDCSWSYKNAFPFDCELTDKGQQLLDYLKKNEWN